MRATALTTTWIAGLFVLGCGSSSTDTGAMQSGGSAGTGGSSATGGTTGSGGASGASGNSSGGTGSGGSPANVCPGTPPPPSGYTLCRSADDCLLSSMLCQPDPNPAGLCGACMPSTRQCETDAGCSNDEVCEPLPYDPCECFGPSTTCVPRCTADSCAEDQRCNAEGHCEPLPCSVGYQCSGGRICNADRPQLDAHGCGLPSCSLDGFQCPDGSVCQPGPGADLRGCLAIACGAGYACPVNFDCDPNSSSAHGCVRRSCSDDSACDCGACVMGRCEDRMYLCEYPAPG